MAQNSRNLRPAKIKHNTVSADLVMQTYSIYEQVCCGITSLSALYFRFYCILRGSVSLTVDPSYNSSIGMLTNSTLPVTTSHSKTTDDKAAFKKHKSHGIELGLLSAGEYFGHIASLHHDKRTSFSALANEYTELLTIENHVFQEVLLDIFQAKLLRTATFLSHQHFFMLWSATQLASLCLNLTEKKMAMGECIYGQGKEVKEIFIIKSGSVRILLDSSMQVPELIFQRIKPPTDYVAKLLESDRKKETMQLHSLQEKAKPKSKREPSATESRISSASVQATKHVQGQNPVMHCRLHEPLNSSPLCVLLPGEFLSGIEVLSGLKQHLFTAVCCSDVELYGMNTILFNHLFPKHGCSTTATEMLQYHIEQVTEWNARHPQVELFSPLLILLQQQLSQCLKCCSKKSGRGRLWRSSDTLADCIMSAIMKKSV